MANHAVVLCAGFGTRMYPLTRNRPKALLAVGGKPALDYLMDQLRDLDGLETVAVVVNARFARQFEAWQQHWRPRLMEGGKRLVLLNDGATAPANRRGACGDLQLAFERLPRAEGYLVAAGDNLFRFDLGTLWRDFQRGSSHRLVALPEADRTRLRRSGVPVWGRGDRVQSFLEKPADPPSDWCCLPLYFLQSTAVPLLAAFRQIQPTADAPGHFIAELCRREKVRAFRPVALRLDIGDLESYRQADRLLGHR
jgi:glucose-1-phosphate thymidylyltransferase